MRPLNSCADVLATARRVDPTPREAYHRTVRAALVAALATAFFAGVGSARAQPVEQVQGNTVIVHGNVPEIAAEGDRVALVVDNALGCPHTAIWRAGTTRLLDLSNPIPGCDWKRFAGLTFSGGIVSWTEFDCGTACYQAPWWWTVGTAPKVLEGQSDVATGIPTRPPSALPTAKTVGGVTVRAATATTLRAGRRSIHAPSPIVDFDLTSAGLFYAYGGRVVFVPMRALH